MNSPQNGINGDDNSHGPGPNRKRAKGSGGVNQFKQGTTKQRNVFEEETREQSCHSKECFQNLTMTKVTEMFHRNIKRGPEYVCTCCDQLYGTDHLLQNVIQIVIKYAHKISFNYA